MVHVYFMYEKYYIHFQRSGIEKLIPDMLIDDYSFEPCGYSMNGISKHGVSVYLFVNIMNEMK